MKNITAELKSFFKATGVRQYQLAEASGVSSATISRIVKGVQGDVRLSTARSLGDAMSAFRSPKPHPDPPAPEPRS
jgi:transcriptional regulator with XRE-family HTH domain